jgi:hypothetical protein
LHKNLITLQCKEWRYKLFHHEQTRSYWLFKYTAYVLSKTMVANGSMSSVSSESEMCLKTSRLCWGEGVLEQSNLVMSKLKQQKYHFELTECSNYPKWPCFINTTVTVMSVWFLKKTRYSECLVTRFIYLTSRMFNLQIWETGYIHFLERGMPLKIYLERSRRLIHTGENPFFIFVSNFEYPGIWNDLSFWGFTQA